MRFMLSFRLPTEKGNQLIREGKLPETLQSIMEELQPEAAYFTDIDGARGELPGMVEPLFHAVGATIKLHVVLTPEDLQKAGPALEQAAQKYG